ncbi:gliding motility lipoprotein GldH [Dysgonomonas sp. 511]|nr:gliding motility lipoprotein GldH [Dysgonomonas sp. 511]
MLIAALFFSCQKGEIYYNFYELDKQEWKQKDTLFFDVDSTSFELNIPYAVSLELVNNTNYPYQNIHFFVQHDLGDDFAYYLPPEGFLLTDEFGKWLGSGFGSTYQKSLPLGKIVFRERHNYRIKVEHAMRDEPLIGIEKVGLKICKGNN